MTHNHTSQKSHIEWSTHNDNFNDNAFEYYVVSLLGINRFECLLFVWEQISLVELNTSLFGLFTAELKSFVIKNEKESVYLLLILK